METQKILLMVHLPVTSQSLTDVEPAGEVEPLGQAAQLSIPTIANLEYIIMNSRNAITKLRP